MRDFAIAVFASTFAETSCRCRALGPAPVGGLMRPERPSLSFGSDSLLALLFAGWIAVMAWVMAEAMAIADENAQFI